MLLPHLQQTYVLSLAKYIKRADGAVMQLTTLRIDFPAIRNGNRTVCHWINIIAHNLFGTEKFDF